MLASKQQVFLFLKKRNLFLFNISVTKFMQTYAMKLSNEIQYIIKLEKNSNFTLEFATFRI